MVGMLKGSLNGVLPFQAAFRLYDAARRVGNWLPTICCLLYR